MASASENVPRKRDRSESSAAFWSVPSSTGSPKSMKGRRSGRDDGVDRMLLIIEADGRTVIAWLRANHGTNAFSVPGGVADSTSTPSGKLKNAPSGTNRLRLVFAIRAILPRVPAYSACARDRSNGLSEQFFRGSRSSRKAFTFWSSCSEFRTSRESWTSWIVPRQTAQIKIAFWPISAGTSASSGAKSGCIVARLIGFGEANSVNRGNSRASCSSAI